MSKSKLKKELQKLTKEQLIEQICELYDSYKQIKEYYETFLNPDNIQVLFEKYKAVIVHEFYPNTNSWNPKTRFSVAKKAIADFAALKPPPKLLAELMMTLVENACQFTYEYGDTSDHFYNSTSTNFERALKYLKAEGLLDDYRVRCEKCLKYASPCGYGFPDAMGDLYDEFYQ